MIHCVYSDVSSMHSFLILTTLLEQMLVVIIIILQYAGSLGKTGCSYTSSGQTLTLVMLSDSTVAAPGFIASFTTAKYDKSNGRRGFKGEH